MRIVKFKDLVEALREYDPKMQLSWEYANDPYEVTYGIMNTDVSSGTFTIELDEDGGGYSIQEFIETSIHDMKRKGVDPDKAVLDIHVYNDRCDIVNMKVVEGQVGNVVAVSVDDHQEESLDEMQRTNTKMKITTLDDLVKLLRKYDPVSRISWRFEYDGELEYGILNAEIYRNTLTMTLDENGDGYTVRDFIKSMTHYVKNNGGDHYTARLEIHADYDQYDIVKVTTETAYMSGEPVVVIWLAEHKGPLDESTAYSKAIVKQFGACLLG